MAKNPPYLTARATAALLELAAIFAQAAAGGGGINDPSAGGLAEFHVYRPTRTRTTTGGYTVTEVELEGSPFSGYLKILPKDAIRAEAPPGTATVDRSLALFFMDPTLDIRVNDVAILPQEAVRIAEEQVDGGTITEFEAVDNPDLRAKITRTRLNAGQIECALEMGAV